MAKKSTREYDAMFREPVFSYCFNAAEPVESYKDNTFDEHQFLRGELCSFAYEWEKEIQDYD